jgi:hypothetical protein
MSCPAIGRDGLPLYIDSNHARAASAREAASFLDETVVSEAEVQRRLITIRK